VFSKLGSWCAQLKECVLDTRWFSSADGAAPLHPLSGPRSRGRQTLICFSHLRWNFVFQRPQHLMSRFAKGRRVIFWEEPIYLADLNVPAVERRTCAETGVIVVTPQLPEALSAEAQEDALRELLNEMLEAHEGDLVRWYYTPTMLRFSRHLSAVCTVYDCMDGPGGAEAAAAELASLEQELLTAADVVFTSGHSLWEAKRGRHPNVHPFPSSVDRSHFARARRACEPPADQAAIPAPRLGLYGVIDQRFDLDLLAAVADARPEWSVVIIGPVVDRDPAGLPRRSNLHYLGPKDYEELPRYLAGWDAALTPFALNDATRFISAARMPEYLAAGRPVVSTPLVDVVRQFGELAAVRLASDPAEFVAACETALAMSRERGGWLREIDAALAASSWDETFARMNQELSRAAGMRRQALAEAQASVGAPPAAPVVRPAARRKPFDYLIVGAGFAGSVLAERLASQLGKRVMLIDRRPHVGGDAYDEKDAAGVLVHRYGAHAFHTNSDAVAGYLSQFTRWRPYEHRVLAALPNGVLAPSPINRTTLNTVHGLDLTTDEAAAAFLATQAKSAGKNRSLQAFLVSSLGRELYETFFKGLVHKQYGVAASQLDPSAMAQPPARTGADDRSFTDKFQNMPADGYTRMFDNMLDQPGIELQLGVDFDEIRNEAVYDQLIFTGPIDSYFEHRYGELPYRSLRFRHETLDQEWWQPVAVVDYPARSTPYLRITEHKHMTGQAIGKTTITYEYPSAEGEPHCPVPRPENLALYRRYAALARRTPNVQFVGRLATYRHCEMDQVVAQALAAFRRIAERESRAAIDAARAASPPLLIN